MVLSPIRDPQGNVLPSYEREYFSPTDFSTEYPGYSATGQDHVEVFHLQEYALYGSKRLGLQKNNQPLSFYSFTGSSFDADGYFSAKNNPQSIAINTAPAITPLIRGKKLFELSNHLGNVLAIVSDRRLQVADANLSLGYYFKADMLKVQDYYPFGMTMPEREIGIGAYRYGFNGKETDNETDLQDYGFRIYNPRIGKFLSVDPLAPEYPWYTPYQFAGNKPIRFIDLDGLEKFDVMIDYDNKRAWIRLTNATAEELKVKWYNTSSPNELQLSTSTFFLSTSHKDYFNVVGVSKRLKKNIRVNKTTRKMMVPAVGEEFDENTWVRVGTKDGALLQTRYVVYVFNKDVSNDKIIQTGEELIRRYAKKMASVNEDEKLYFDDFEDNLSVQYDIEPDFEIGGKYSWKDVARIFDNAMNKVFPEFSHGFGSEDILEKLSDGQVVTLKSKSSTDPGPKITFGITMFLKYTWKEDTPPGRRERVDKE